MRVGKANGREWLRLAEAAAALGVSHNTLRHWSDEGRLRCYRSPGGHRRYRRADIDAALRANEGLPGGPPGATGGEGTWRESAVLAVAAVAALGTGATACSLTVEDGDETLRLVAVYGDGEEAALGARFPFAVRPAEAEVVRSRRRLIIPDMRRTRLLARAAADEYCRKGCQGLLVLPVALHDGRFGALRLGDSRGPHSFDMAAVRFAEFMAHHAGILLSGDDPGAEATTDVPQAAWLLDGSRSAPEDSRGAGWPTESRSPGRPPDAMAMAARAAVEAASLGEGRELTQLRRRERDLALLQEVWLQDTSRLTTEQVLRDIVERLALATEAPIAEVYAVEADTMRALVSYDSGRWDTAWEGVVLRLARYPTSLRAVQTGDAVTVQGLDDRSLDSTGRFSLEKWGYQAHLSLPLVSGGRVLGLIDLYDYVPHDFTPDLGLVRSLAQVAARALESERLTEHARRRNRMVTELAAVGDICTGSSDGAVIARGVAARLLSAVDAASCQVFRITADGARCAASHDRSGPDVEAEGTLMHPGEYPTAVAAMNAHDLLTVSSLDDERLTEGEKALYRAGGWVSEVCVPLVLHERLIGFIDICDTRSRSYSEYADFLHGVAGSVAVALEGTRLLEEVERRRADLEALAAVGELCAGAGPGDAALEQLAAGILRTLGAADCDIFALDDGRLRCLVSVDERGRDDSVTARPLDADAFPATALALRSGQVVVVPDLDDPRLTDPERRDMQVWGFRSEVCVPLLSGGSVRGLIDIFDRRARDYGEHLDYLAAVGRVAAAIVEAALPADEDATEGDTC